MKNKIMFIILIVFVLILAVSMIRGMKIGNFQILSISQIKEKNDEVNKKIEETSEVIKVKYPDNINTLEETYDEYTVQKQKYEELSGFADDGDTQIYETKKYDISYLWKTLGKYATSRNLTIGIDVKKNNTSNLYDLSFSVSGTYVNISQFITDIENDSDLYFRIYDFKMTGSSILSATFTVKNVNIDSSTITITTNTNE